jgi:hypothetical protein
MSLETDFENGPKDFAGKYAFLPDDKAAGYVERNEQQMTVGKFKGFRHTVVNQSQGIARVQLVKGMHNVRGDVVKVQPSLTTGAGLPVYFLPWDRRGAAVELTIPNANPALPDHQHPRFFFTAVLSGCSIMFKGTPQNPTIFHCGTGGTGADEVPTQGDSNQFFLDLLNRCTMYGVGTLGPVVQQVRSDEYMVPRMGAPAKVQLEKDVNTAMEALYKNRLKMVNTIAWGVVFGFRAQNSRDWKFYLQQNVTIQYYEMVDVLQTVVKKKFKGLIKTTQQVKTRQQGAFHNVAKPIELTRVFPGRGVAKATSTWRAIRG